MIIENIVRRIRESRMNEASGEYEYKFDIPWRETISDDYDEVGHHYRMKDMDYADQIMTAAKEEFDDADIAQYARRDRRTEDCGIKKMTMDFDSNGDCIVTVLTSLRLDQDQIEGVINYLEGQMSDGWGEGFEQREVDSYTEESEEWVEDDEDESGGYYETNDVNYYVYGQFWWSGDSTHPYQIELVSGPDDKNRPTSESIEESLSKDEIISILKNKYHRNYKYDKYDYDQLINIYNQVLRAEKDKELRRDAAEESNYRRDHTCPECGTPLTDAGKCPVCDELDSRYGED